MARHGGDGFCPEGEETARPHPQCACVACPTYAKPEAFADRLHEWTSNPQSQPDLERWLQEGGRSALRRPSPMGLLICEHKRRRPDNAEMHIEDDLPKGRELPLGEEKTPQDVVVAQEMDADAAADPVSLPRASGVVPECEGPRSIPEASTCQTERSSTSAEMDTPGSSSGTAIRTQSSRNLECSQ